MPLQATSGAASYDAFGGGVPAVPAYIEEVFSTWLYTGTGAAQTITNGIDLSTKGGLVWTKQRGQVQDHLLADTARGNTKYLSSNTTDGEGTSATRITSFDTTGYTLGTGSINGNTNTYASWTFRKQPKFFDVVTYTGNGTAGRTIAHNLGSVPGCIIVKQLGGGSTGGVNNWFVYHRSLGGTKYLALDDTLAAVTSSSTWNNTDPTSTVFTIGGTSDCNDSGGTYVAYLFAHDAGGFGLTGTDNVISCGSYTTVTSPVSVNLGYEPQWLLVKRSSGVGDWRLVDNMRGWSLTQGNILKPNTTAAEADAWGGGLFPTATGFTDGGVIANNSTMIYIAIRRGPMKVPTSGTSVYENTAYTGNNTAERKIGSSVLTDLVLLSNRDATATDWSTYAHYFYDRLRGQNVALSTSKTNSESSGWTSYFNFDMNTGWDTGSTVADQVYLNKSSSTYVSNAFKRAPSFFDVVCYTNNASGASEQVNNHNLGVIPELAITKVRNDVNSWYVASNIGSTTFDRFFLDSSAASVNLDYVSASTYKGFTSTTFTVGSSSIVGAGGFNVVTYLFATCAGVSKVGSYTGTATTKQIDCGFTGGARFVLIKRTDSTGDWYVWDTARGIVSGNDPYLLLNSTAAEVTNTDYIDTYSAGFEISSTAPAAINASGGTFIFLAIA